ncbi:MAG: hypothetical protein IPG76_22860 [Acidobacteria bacterium]|nr:hypothetical protein [Acidobacteriota bacterium]
MNNYGYYAIEHPAPSQPTWFTNPRPGDRYVLVEDTKFWAPLDRTSDRRVQHPAFVTLEEVLADRDLVELNNTDIYNVINSIKGRITDGAGAEVSFIPVPTIYLGNRTDFATGRSCVAFSPGPANFQPIGPNIYFPRQFGPRDSSGMEIFEAMIRSRVPSALFTDDWDLYHRLLGEVHCGTSVKRQFPLPNWWRP